MKDKPSYDSAYEELQSIVDKIQSEDISLDKLSDEVKRASELILYCKKKLRTIESEVEKSLNI